MSDSTAAMLQLLALLPPASRAKMSGLYREALLIQLGEMLSALAMEPPGPAARTLSHRLAGSAAMMQDGALSAVLRAIEDGLAAGDTAAARARVGELRRRAAETLAALDAPG